MMDSAQRLAIMTKLATGGATVGCCDYGKDNCPHEKGPASIHSGYARMRYVEPDLDDRNEDDWESGSDSSDDFEIDIGAMLEHGHGAAAIQMICDDEYEHGAEFGDEYIDVATLLAAGHSALDIEAIFGRKKKRKKKKGLLGRLNPFGGGAKKKKKKKKSSSQKAKELKAKLKEAEEKLAAAATQG